MTNPYAALPDHHFWRRAVGGIEHHLVDPMVAPRFRIGAGERVATAGSCFAQHISRRLGEIGFTYFVPEDGAALDPAERTRRGYGIFSARYGNIYTAAQLAQLMEEAYGRRTPGTRAMARPDGRLADPLRPGVEPDGFGSEAELLAERAGHLAHVRAVFEQADVFVFTLGLTEAWRDRADGTVLPLAPGVAAGEFDAGAHEFVNFGVEEVQGQLSAFLGGLRAVNPGVRVLLTVSPVPLIATYTDRHVLTATAYSKAVLRVAAETARAAHRWVDYFPSYEIITGPHAGGLYHEADARAVNRLGVAHAMRCFVANYAEGAAPVPAGSAPATGAGAGGGIVCDEEMLDAVGR